MSARHQVRMRPLETGDREQLLVWRNSPDVHPYMYADHRITREEHDRWFDKALVDQTRLHRIVELNGAPVGLVSLTDIDRAHGRCTLARYIGEPSARGLGLGDYIEFWLIEQAFGPLCLGKLWSEVLATNEGAWRSHLRHGFVQEARFRRHIVKNGEAVDVLGLGLLAEDWAPRREEMAARLRAKGFAIPS